ncbi:unnamed protein product [Caenorhabditis angaria]|uniref:SAM-dependent MTase RsmB/NOP-type domain-containing protein n=1 Tax=Caenorhabditis angaria TaxID=860376 RepID=A0A9P1IDT2_9PELO|nr:unnamed protein product [Caenorhabditis angaria]
MAIVKKKKVSTTPKSTPKENGLKRKLEVEDAQEAETPKVVKKTPKKKPLKKQNGTAATPVVEVEATPSSENGPKKKKKKVVKKVKLFEEEEKAPKQKAQLIDEDDDEEEFNIGNLDIQGDDDDDDDLRDDYSDDEEDEDNLPIEKKSAALDKIKEKMLKEGEEELQLNIANQEKFELPTVEDIEAEMKSAPNLEIVRQRIADVIQVLGDFKARRDPNKSRLQYVEVLQKDLCSQFGYNEYLMAKFMDLFPNGVELLQFLEANDNPRPVTIRANSLKVKRRDLAKNLINRGMNVDPAAEWTKVGLVVYDSQVPVGATPEYLAGHYMIQGLNSLLPVMALAPQPGDRVLDMCSAPGGKTSHIASLMKNSGVLFANDANFDRCRAIIGNLHRLGVNNTVVCNLGGEEFGKIRPNGFDRILLDAPCSGTGVIWKDQSVKTSKDSQDVQRRHTMQRQLILSAMDALDANSPNGGYLVYSTCSVLVEENEAVVNFLLERRHCELVPTGLTIGVDGYTRFRDYRFHSSLSMTKRYYPHVHNIDGFFVAKIKKLSNAKMSKQEVLEKEREKQENKKKSQAEEDSSDDKKKPAKKAGKKSKEDSDSEDDDGTAPFKNVGSGARANKKRRNQKKAQAKQDSLKEDDGFNTVGNIKKARKVKEFKARVPKRAAARTGAKAVKNKRKKMLAKQQ